MTDKEILDAVVTPTEAAILIGISERGIRWNCKSGKYTARKSGHTWLMLINGMTDKKILEAVVTPTEAAILIGISERGIRWNCESGKYTARKSGRTWLMLKSSLPEPK